MRTNIEINDDLMKSAFNISGLRTKKAVIEEGLKLLVSLGNQARVKEYRGKLQWHGSLNKMRTDK